MFEVAWKEITAKGRIVCKCRAFKSDTARETGSYLDFPPRQSDEWHARRRGLRNTAGGVHHEL